MRRSASAILACALAVAGCSTAPATPTPTPTATAATPSPSAGPTFGTPPAAPLVHGSARDLGDRIGLAPSLEGSLYVSIPADDASVLTLLDASGSPRPGWPISIAGVASCPGLFPADDGSVRLVCTTTEPGEPESPVSPLTAFAFTAQAAPLAGWPVELGCCFGARALVDDTLTLVEVPNFGGGPSVVRIVSVGPDGAVERGAETPIGDCCAWSIGLDGTAYGTTMVSGLDGQTPERSQLVALTPSGLRWADPVAFPGLAVTPGYATDGRVLVTVGSLVREVSQVHAFEPASGLLLGSSPELVTPTAGFGDVGGCGLSNPMAPLVSTNGSIFVLNWANGVHALGPALRPHDGWPYHPPTPLGLRDARYVREDAYCPSPAPPATGPDGTLYLALEEAPADPGGSIVALGLNGELRPDWPVTIQRQGGEFWAMAAAVDGTVYALAVELESATTSSATLHGIAPDSTVLWRSTIVAP